MLGYDNGLQPGMGDRAAHKGDLAHPRKTDIANVLAAAMEEAVVFFSFDIGADAGFSQG